MGLNSERGPPKDHSIQVWSQKAWQFQKRRFFITFFPMGPMLKLCWLISTVFLGWRAGSLDTILKGDLLRTIALKFGPNKPSSFREEDIQNIFPLGSCVSTMLIYVGRMVGGRGH